MKTNRKINFFLILMLIVYFSPQALSGQIFITEVLYNPEGRSEAGQEWIEIFNSSNSPVSLHGWNFKDNDGAYAIKEVTIKSGEYFLLNNDTVTESFRLNQSGENIIIQDASGNVIDSFDYGGEVVAKDGQSVQKETNNTWAVSAPTPGSGPFSVRGQDQDTNNGSSSQQQSQTNIVTKEVTKYNTVTVQPPQDIFLRITAPETSNAGTTINFMAEVYDATGKIVEDADVKWAFGDGKVARGLSVKYSYVYEGLYLVSAYARKGVLSSEKFTKIKINKANVSVRLDDKYEFVEVYNNSKDNLDLSGWSLRSGYKSFYIPDRTIILPKSSVRFSVREINLNLAKRDKRVTLLNVKRDIVADSEKYKTDSVNSGEVESVSTPASASSDYEGKDNDEKTSKTIPILGTQTNVAGQNYQKQNNYNSATDKKITETRQTTNINQEKDTATPKEGLGLRKAVEENIYKEDTHPQKSAQMAGVGNAHFDIFGLKWLMLLFFVIFVGLFAFYGFSFAGKGEVKTANEEKLHMNINKDYAKEFDIKEIR